MNKKLIVKSILWFFVAFGGTAAILRLINGLGATTALSDLAPWGLWIGFDVMAGVALAAGGFVLAGTVYVFHLERYRPILRATILTAFLGYVIVAIGLIFDLGLPWHIWHPMIFHQPRSVLFEVAMCVIIYLNVLGLEIAPVVLEHPWFQHPIFQRIYKFLKYFTVPLVILGIMLSTLHQSSLGSLFLIMPFRVHELWYTPIIYVLYFVSAVGLGLSMIIVESTVTGYLYDHKPRLDLMKGLGRAASVVLGIYILIRFIDLGIRGSLGTAFNGSWQSNLFLFEICVSVVIPAILFNLRKVQSTIKGLLGTALLVVFGFIMNRQDIFLTMTQKKNFSYFPSIGEIAVTLSLVSGAMLVFFVFVENFKIFGDGHEREQSKAEFPDETAGFTIWPGASIQKSFIAISITVTIGIGLAFAILPSSAIKGYQYPKTPVVKSVGWDTLRIDGNGVKEHVMFPHTAHQKRIGVTREACRECHHMSRPMDGPTSCYICHSDMYLESMIFDHIYHQNKLGDNKSCINCHGTATKSKDRVKTCDTKDCHPTMFPKDTTYDYVTVGYMDALHLKCKVCHEEKAKTAEFPHNPNLGYCVSCHPGMEEHQERAFNQKRSHLGSHSIELIEPLRHSSSTTP